MPRVAELFIRADGGASIGSGHICRCLAIARQAEAHGMTVRFLVSTEDSKGMVAAGGFEAVVLGDDPHCLGEPDARRVARLSIGAGAALLVDAYGVNEPYFDVLSEAGIRTAYIDDGFFYSSGYHARMRLPVDVVIDYRFSADERALSELYQGSGTAVLAGPRFAPVDARFRGAARGVAADVSRVLVTCGSTNPGGTLERMTRACRVVFPDARIDVVVGKFARFELGDAGVGSPMVCAGDCVGGASVGPEGSDDFAGAIDAPVEKPVVAVFHGLDDLAPLMREAGCSSVMRGAGRVGGDSVCREADDGSAWQLGVPAERPAVRVLRGLTDLAPLMREADLVVSAAGTTLYELCAVGVPTVAVPIVDNQLANARGFAEHGCGAAITHLGWTNEELEETLRAMRPADVRRAYAQVMRSVVPGDGADLIVRGIMSGAKGQYQ